MIRFKSTVVCTLLIFFICGCTSVYDSLLKSDDIDLKYKAAMEYYNNGKFRKSAPLFESLILVSQGTQQEDSVQYYNAMSNYRYGDYITAEQNFARFLEVFPRSPFTEEAKFLRIKCLYEATYRWELDQVPTQKAMAEIAEFMYDNPTSQYYPICSAMLDEFNERLDRKAYEAAKLYYKMEDYRAANYALKQVLRENATNQYRRQILYYSAMSSFKYADMSVKEMQKQRYMDFIDDYYNFVGEYPQSPERKQLDNYFVKAQRAVGMNVGLDSAQVAAAGEIDIMNKYVGKREKSDRHETKQAIKEAKKAVEASENENDIARKILQQEQVKSTRKADKQQAKAEREEALRLYKEAKARAKASKRAERSDDQ